MRSINKILISILLMSILVTTIVTSAEIDQKDIVVHNEKQIDVVGIYSAQNGSNLSENVSHVTDTKMANDTNKEIKIQETNLTIEEIKIIKDLINEEKLKSKEKPLSIIERMRKAKVPSELIPSDTTNITKSDTSNISAIATNLIVYSNPASSISVQGTDFSNSIYTDSYVNWASWNFYLQDNSYAYIDVSGNVNSFKDVKAYVVNIDNSQYTSWAYDDQTCRDTGWFSIQPNCDQELQRSKLFYLNKGWHTINLNGYANRYSNFYSVYGFISILAFPEYTAITVLSPNGGETWTRGSTRSITWKKDGQPGTNVKIELYKAGVLSSVISSITPDDGQYSWFIPTYTPIGSDYKIKISSTSEPAKYYDWSNNNFIIN